MLRFVRALTIAVIFGAGTAGGFFIYHAVIHCLAIAQNSIVAKGHGYIEASGEQQHGSWTLFADGTVVVTGNEPETWLRVGSSHDIAAIPDDSLDKKRAAGGWVLWENTSGKYRYEYLNGAKDTSR